MPSRLSDAQRAQRSAAGKACLAKHGREHYVAAGRKGGRPEILAQDRILDSTARLSWLESMIV